MASSELGEIAGGTMRGLTPDLHAADRQAELEGWAKTAGSESSLASQEPDGEPWSPDEKPALGEERWQRQLQSAVRTADGLRDALDLTPGEYQAAQRAEQAGFPISITPYYLSLIDRSDPLCPIRRQVVPAAQEGEPMRGDLRDPLGEEDHELAPNLVQRYPDRVLLLASDRCAVYCRFCTRSRMVGAGGGPLSAERLLPALRAIAADPKIRDVIISGGDPVMMATGRLEKIVAAVRAIPTVETIRLATRVPVVLPARITDEWTQALRPHHPLFVMTHFNHPRELTEQSRAALRRLADAGFPVMNQTVLLRGVNDRAEILSELFRGLVRERARPYYLLQMDPVAGMGHLRTRVKDGLALMEQLQGRLSGIALPKLILDAPGGFGKVPLSPAVVVEESPGRTRVRTYRGVEVDYFDPPED